MFKTHAHRTLDMTQGPVFSQIIFFALPIMLSSILQLLFNAADTIVVGRFAGSQALAAVGSVGSLNNLIISLCIGLSVGANVLVARFTGSREHKNVSETVHTAVLLSLVGGAFLLLHLTVFYDAGRMLGIVVTYKLAFCIAECMPVAQFYFGSIASTVLLLLHACVKSFLVNS